MALDSGIHAGMTVLFHSIWLMTAGIIYCELPIRNVYDVKTPFKDNLLGIFTDFFSRLIVL
jgi:hypothetical protein